MFGFVDVWLSALLVVSNAQWQAVKIDNLKWDDAVVPVSKTIPGAPFGMNALAYNALKWITLAFFPATGALYFTLANLWMFPYGEQVAATLAAIAAFLGLILGFSEYQYNQSQQ